MNTKEKVELFLKGIQTAFIIIGGVIALLKFSDYVDEQKHIRKSVVVDVFRYYDENVEYDRDFLSEAAEIFRYFDKDKEVTKRYLEMANVIEQRYIDKFDEHTNGLDSAIFMAKISGEEEIVNQFFCSDSHLIWVSLGPSILKLRRALNDDSLYENIENQMISCGKFTSEQMKHYKLVIAKSLN